MIQGQSKHWFCNHKSFFVFLQFSLPANSRSLKKGFRLSSPRLYQPLNPEQTVYILHRVMTYSVVIIISKSRFFIPACLLETALKFINQVLCMP
jgi:hypothetical protein